MKAEATQTLFVPPGLGPAVVSPGHISLVHGQLLPGPETQV